MEVDRADEQVGVDILLKALEFPLRFIAQNAGAEGAIVVEKVRSDKNDRFGYNAQTDTHEDLVESGVIDPTKVVRTTLQNAASIAGLLLTTEAVVVEKPEEEKGGGMPPDGGRDVLGAHEAYLRKTADTLGLHVRLFGSGSRSMTGCR